MKFREKMTKSKKRLLGTARPENCLKAPEKRRLHCLHAWAEREHDSHGRHRVQLVDFRCFSGFILLIHGLFWLIFSLFLCVNECIEKLGEEILDHRKKFKGNFRDM